MHDAGESSIIEQWKQVAAQETDREQRLLYAGLALVFAELAGRRAEWEAALEDWDMGESEVINRWCAEGELKGEWKGELKAKRDNLLRVLDLRFTSRVPTDFVEAVNATTDLEELVRCCRDGSVPGYLPGGCAT